MTAPSDLNHLQDKDSFQQEPMKSEEEELKDDNNNHFLKSMLLE